MIAQIVLPVRMNEPSKWMLINHLLNSPVFRPLFLLVFRTAQPRRLPDVPLIPSLARHFLLNPQTLLLNAAQKLQNSTSGYRATRKLQGAFWRENALARNKSNCAAWNVSVLSVKREKRLRDASERRAAEPPEERRHCRSFALVWRRNAHGPVNKQQSDLFCIVINCFPATVTALKRLSGKVHARNESLFTKNGPRESFPFNVSPLP